MKKLILFYWIKFRTFYNDIKKIKLKILLSINVFLFIWYLLLFNDDINENLLVLPFIWGLLYYNNNLISIIVSTVSANYLYKTNMLQYVNSQLSKSVKLDKLDSIIELSYSDNYYYILSVIFLSISCVIFYVIFKWDDPYKSDNSLIIENMTLQNDNYKLMNEINQESLQQIQLVRDTGKQWIDEIKEIKLDIKILKDKHDIMEKIHEKDLSDMCDIIEKLKDNVDTVVKEVSKNTIDYTINEVKGDRIVHSLINNISDIPSSTSEIFLNVVDNYLSEEETTFCENDMSSTMDESIKIEKQLKNV